MQDYILGRVSKGKIKNKIKLNTRVTNVTFSNEKFEITYQDKAKDEILKELCTLMILEMLRNLEEKM